MLQSIKGKSAIITGASSGLGRATAVALAKEGVNFICQKCQKVGRGG